MIRKIAIIGPESTGKSTLTRQLGLEFEEPIVKEFGRSYLEKFGPSYSFEDLGKITQGMIEQEEIAIKSAKRFIICDTDLIMMQVWYEEKYGKVPAFLEEKISEKPYQFYMLCYPDLEWENDPLRENPDSRDYLYERYKSIISDLKIPYSIIKGEYRWHQAASSIRNFMKTVK